MVGAFTLGVLAACVVLFVPMGMAGWHLSRNKMLFFSAALFITLAVGVHVSPYLPSVAQFLSSLSTPPTVPVRQSCLSFAHQIVWERDTTSPNHTAVSWNWDRSTPVVACGFQKLGRSDAADLLNGSWVLVAGDSQARLFALALLGLLVDPVGMEAVEGDLFKRHSNYQIVVEEHGVKVDYVWAPYESNLTDVLGQLKGGREYPDVLVLGTGLWHMLHFTNASEYGSMLDSLMRSTTSLAPILPEFGTAGVEMPSPHMFWLGMPTLVNSMLNTEEKKEKMTPLTWKAYDKELSERKLLRGSGGPLVLLDVSSLSRNCGLICTIDGMHYDRVVYEATLQVMLNVLLIDSQQRI